MSTKLGSIPSVTADNLLQVGKAIKNILDVREGQLGDPLDANVTFRDLVDSGTAALRPGWTARSAASPIIPPWSEPDGYDATQDLIPPPVPVNFVATGGFAIVQLKWDEPIYRNHAYAEIWSASTNVIGNAVKIGTSTSQFYVDSLGTSTTRFYWIRFVSQANITGPYNAVNGTSATTATNPTLVLGSLTGQITATQLNADLTSRINLIDAPSTTTNSVNNRLAVIQGQVNDILSIPVWSSTATYAVGDQATYGGALYRATAASTNVSTSNTAYWQKVGDYTSLGSAVAAHTTQISSLQSGIGQEIVDRTALATQLRGSYAGTDPSLISEGLFYQERIARSDAVSAVAGTVTSLTAVVNTKTRSFYQSTAPTGSFADPLRVGDVWVDTNSSYVSDYFASDYSIKSNRMYRWDGTQWADAMDYGFADTLAAINIEQLARVNSDAATASQITTLVSNFAANAAALTDEISTRATADTSLSNRITSLTSTVTSNNTTLAARIASEETARSDADSAFGQTLTSVSATASGKNKTYSQGTAPADGLVLGDLWIDTANQNKPYRWNGSAWVSVRDGSIADVSAAVVTLDQTRIGYATLNSTGEVFDNSGAITNKDTVTAWNVANPINQATWHQGIPFATAVKQVSISDGTTTASLEQRFTAQKTTNSGLLAQYTVKVDVGGRIAGFGLASTSATSGRKVNGMALYSALLKLYLNKTDADQNLAQVFNGRILGDIDGGGAINLTDVLAALKYQTGDYLPPDQLSYIKTTMLTQFLTDQVKYAAYLSEDLSNSSEFSVLADRFSVGPSTVVSSSQPTVNLYNGYVWLDTSVSPSVRRYYDATAGAWTTIPTLLPFVIQAAPTYINGVYVPAGVYMADAFIGNGTITNAKIGNAVIDDAKIANLDAAKITTGLIAAARLDAGVISAKVANIDAAVITTGTISSALIGNLDASVITTGSLSADRIDGRNLAIKDGAGNVIFGAGTKLDTPYIVVGAATTAASGGEIVATSVPAATAGQTIFNSGNVTTVTTTGAPLNIWTNLRYVCASYNPNVTQFNLAFTLYVNGAVVGWPNGHTAFQQWQSAANGSGSLRQAVGGGSLLFRHVSLPAGTHQLSVQANVIPMDSSSGTLTFGSGGFVSLQTTIVAMENKL